LIAAAATLAAVETIPPARWPGGVVSRVAVPGGHLVVEQCGAGPPLLLLHGWTLDRRMWLPQLPLARQSTLVAIDRRGFGQSTANPDLAAEPDDVHRVADALGLARFHLLGMSQGGRVALAFAARSPERLASLTLQGTALDGMSGDDEAVPIAAMTAAASRNDLAAMRVLVQRHALMQAKSALGARLVAEMLASYDGRDLIAPVRQLPAFADAIVGAGFPVTAIVGAADTDQRKANARALGVFGAKVVELARAGHLCNLDCPDAFNMAIGANFTA
jgi:3-oxoadipate enol-lactonase